MGEAELRARFRFSPLPTPQQQVGDAVFEQVELIDVGNAADGLCSQQAGLETPRRRRPREAVQSTEPDSRSSVSPGHLDERSRITVRLGNRAVGSAPLGSPPVR